MYRAMKRGYALVALGAHLSEAERNFHCFNTTWPPERHIELPEVIHSKPTNLRCHRHFLYQLS